MMTGPPMPSPITLMGPGARASIISWPKMTCSISVAPRPPYSLGQLSPMYPASYSARCHPTRRSSHVAEVASSLSLSAQAGRFARSQARTSSRKARSAGVRSKSMRLPLTDAGVNIDADEPAAKPIPSGGPVKAAVLERLAGPEGITLADRPEPQADGASVLVDVYATGVSFPDLLRSQGRYQLRPGCPFVLG